MAHPLLSAAPMTLKNVCAFLAVVAAGCAMKMNGKTVGFGGDSAAASPGGGGSSSGSSSDSSSSAEEGESSDPQARGHYKDYPRYPEAPVDPLLSVKDGKPVIVNSDDWKVRASEGSDCTAVHDHCIDARTWFYEDDISRDGKIKNARRAVLGTFTNEGVEGPHNTRATGRIINEDNPYTAYKTVPATRKNLEKGTLVIAMTYPNVTPSDGGSVFEDIGWQVGIIDRVDWDLMKVYLVGSEDDSIAIAATRVAVLSYRPGEKVMILGGKKANELQVKPADVILPDPPVQ
jgi:hypothetical protein